MGAVGEMLEQAHEHRTNGEYDVAIELYQQVLAAEPELAEALWGLGLSLMNTGEFDQALETIVHACEADPQNQLYLLDAGKHYTMLGMYDEAKPFFERVVALGADTKYGVDAQKQLSYYD
jgi:tetratricopeptide (TPR) repeat protein